MVSSLERWHAALFWEVSNQSENTVCIVANKNIPYCADKLTRLMQTAFGGNCAITVLFTALHSNGAVTDSVNIAWKQGHARAQLPVCQLTEDDDNGLSQ